jgi:hypothetical protein
MKAETTAPYIDAIKNEKKVVTPIITITYNDMHCDVIDDDLSHSVYIRIKTLSQLAIKDVDAMYTTVKQIIFASSKKPINYDKSYVLFLNGAVQPMLLFLKGNCLH